MNLCDLQRLTLRASVDDGLFKSNEKGFLGVAIDNEDLARSFFKNSNDTTSRKYAPNINFLRIVIVTVVLVFQSPVSEQRALFTANNF